MAPSSSAEMCSSVLPVVGCACVSAVITDLVWRKLPVVVVVPDEAVFVLPDVKAGLERGLCAGCARIEGLPAVGLCRLEFSGSHSELGDRWSWCTAKSMTAPGLLGRVDVALWFIAALRKDA
jgi:hypothetical protein